MAKKKIEIRKEYLEKILNDKIIVEYTEIDRERNLEEDIDDKIKNSLKSVFGNKIIGKKTGKPHIDKNIPPYHGDEGNGHPDVMLFNFFDDNEIDIIVENKNFTSNESAIDQAIVYSRVGEKINKPCRVAIGNNPSKKLQVNVLVKEEYLPLIINGKEVDYFFGKEILKLIYENPNINEFVLTELKEKKFTQKDFHNVIKKLKKFYRQIPEIQNNDDLSINFTVAFVALKMIMEKQDRKWIDINGPDAIKVEIERITGRVADQDLKEKFEDIFIMRDKDGNEVFNFYKLVDNIYAREYSDQVKKDEYILMKIHRELSIIPAKDLEIDLFGEVYECLASKKTKSLLGKYFTRRHIIQAIVRMFLTEDDIQNIVEYNKLIADPCCGTGGFLTESFKYISDYCKQNHPQYNISELANKIVIGYDINNYSIGRTRINMTLAGDGFSDIRRINTLTNTEIKKDIDYILTNIPYGKGDYAISNPNSNDEFLKSNNNKRLELNFVIKIIEMLKKGGKAAIIVPEGLLDAPTLAGFREYLLKQCKLKTIISLPKFAFAPYTKWKTYVIFIEKRNTPIDTIEEVIRRNESTWAYIVDNDGYANSDKRFATDLRDENNAWLHNELQQYEDKNGVKQSSKIEEAYEEERDDNYNTYYNEWNEPIKGKKCGFISIKEIAQKQISKYKSLTVKEVSNKLKEEANNNKILSQDLYEILISNCTISKNLYSIKKENFIEDGNLKEEFISIFEELNIEYDPESNKYYSTDSEEKTYVLSLIPEKYLRKKEVKLITIKELDEKIKEIEMDIKKIL